MCERETERESTSVLDADDLGGGCQAEALQQPVHEFQLSRLEERSIQGF